MKLKCNWVGFCFLSICFAKPFLAAILVVLVVRGMPPTLPCPEYSNMNQATPPQKTGLSLQLIFKVNWKWHLKHCLHDCPWRIKCTSRLNENNTGFLVLFWNGVTKYQVDRRDMHWGCESRLGLLFNSSVVCCSIVTGCQAWFLDSELVFPKQTASLVNDGSLKSG